MAEAIIGGARGAGLVAPGDVSVGEPVAARREYLAEAHGVAVFADNAEAVRGAELAFLAVKPQSLGEVMPGLGRALEAEQTVVSIVAGATMDALTGGLGHDAVVRVMPNTPAQIGEGMSVWTASEAVSAEAREAVGSIFADAWG